MMGFDPNFHYVGMTFNPEAFADMKDKYFLLNGRGYPDTVNPGPISTHVVRRRLTPVAAAAERHHDQQVRRADPRAAAPLGPERHRARDARRPSACR